MTGPPPSPCKYCGCTDIRYKSSGGLARALCRKCHAEGPIVWWEDVAKGATPHETMTNRGNAAIAAWNTRAPDPAKVQALVEALRGAEEQLRNAADYWGELCNDAARAPFTLAAKQARAALAAWVGGGE